MMLCCIFCVTLPPNFTNSENETIRFYISREPPFGDSQVARNGVEVVHYEQYMFKEIRRNRIKETVLMTEVLYGTT